MWPHLRQQPRQRAAALSRSAAPGAGHGLVHGGDPGGVTRPRSLWRHRRCHAISTTVASMAASHLSFAQWRPAGAIHGLVYGDNPVGERQPSSRRLPRRRTATSFAAASLGLVHGGRGPRRPTALSTAASPEASHNLCQRRRRSRQRIAVSSTGAPAASRTLAPTGGLGQRWCRAKRLGGDPPPFPVE